MIYVKKVKMTDTCLYLLGCKVSERPICRGNFERCTIYQRLRVLDKHKPKKGLQKFIERYPNYPRMFIGSKI